MKIDVLTLFPEFFDGLKDYGIIGRALRADIFSLTATDIRDYTLDKHRKVDDEIYGGGPGMLMTPEPIHRAIEARRSEEAHVIFLSPQGSVLTQNKLEELSTYKHLILLCGHYEGIDERIIELDVDEEISIGDYVLSGGEIPAMVLIDGVVRWLDGALGNDESVVSDSLSDGLLKCAQYTRPREFMGVKVPDILLTGHHANIEEWKHQDSLERTRKKRPDLYKKFEKESEI